MFLCERNERDRGLCEFSGYEQVGAQEKGIRKKIQNFE